MSEIDYKFKKIPYEEKAAAFKKDVGLETPHNSGLEFGSAECAIRGEIYFEWLVYGKDKALKMKEKMSHCGDCRFASRH